MSSTSEYNFDIPLPRYTCVYVLCTSFSLVAHTDIDFWNRTSQTTLNLLFGDFSEVHDSSDEEDEWQPSMSTDSQPLVRVCVCACSQVCAFVSLVLRLMLFYRVCYENFGARKKKAAYSFDLFTGSGRSLG